MSLSELHLDTNIYDHGNHLIKNWNIHIRPQRYEFPQGLH